MHPLALKEVIKVCRERDRQDDLPVPARPEASTLELAVLELARRLDAMQAKEPAANFPLLIDAKWVERKIASDPDDNCDAGVLHPESPAMTTQADTQAKPLSKEEQQ